MVLKSTGLSSRFQHKNRFWKICTGSWDIGKNIQNYAGLVWRPDFWHVLLNISGPGAYFSNRFLRWNRELKPVNLSTINPKNKTIYFRYKGGCRLLKLRTPQLKPIKTENDIDFFKTYMYYHKNYYQPISNGIFRFLAHPSNHRKTQNFSFFW